MDYFTGLRLHETNYEHRQQRENSIQHFYFQNALIHGCIYFHSGKVTSLLGKNDGLSYVTP